MAYMCGAAINNRKKQILSIWKWLQPHIYSMLENTMYTSWCICFANCTIWVEVWRGSISSSRWNDIEKLQKAFIRRHLGIKSTTPYILLLLEIGRRPIGVYAMVWVLRYEIHIHQMDDNRLSKKAWAASTCLQKTRKSKVLSTRWVLDIHKWFKWWEVGRYLNIAPKDVCVDTFQMDLLQTY